MAIAVRSVKTEMMKRGHPRSGLVGVPSWDARRRRLSHLARTQTRCLGDTRCYGRTKPFTELTVTERSKPAPCCEIIKKLNDSSTSQIQIC